MHLPIKLYQLVFVFGRLELDKKGSIKHKIISFQLFYYDFNLLQNKIVHHIGLGVNYRPFSIPCITSSYMQMRKAYRKRRINLNQI